MLFTSVRFLQGSAVNYLLCDPTCTITLLPAALRAAPGCVAGLWLLNGRGEGDVSRAQHGDCFVRVSIARGRSGVGTSLGLCSGPSPQTCTWPCPSRCAACFLWCLPWPRLPRPCGLAGLFCESAPVPAFSRRRFHGSLYAPSASNLHTYCVASSDEQKFLILTYLNSSIFISERCLLCFA